MQQILHMFMKWSSLQNVKVILFKNSFMRLTPDLRKNKTNLKKLVK
jgi:hypothetical protein